MSKVTASIEIPASPEDVWKVVMDPQRLGDWVTIHRRVDSADDGEPRSGFRMEQRIALRGVELRVRWSLEECRPAALAVWHGRGPARSWARTRYALREQDGGTLFQYENEFHAPLGPLGAAASRALVGGASAREGLRALAALRALCG